jgi:ataxia telangiectasia mutated family protein
VFVITADKCVLLQVACQPLAVLVKIHFVPIFSVCIVLHCSKRSGWERGAKVLQSSILCLTELSESERDKLIKKHMVCSYFLKYKALSVEQNISVG